MTRLIDADALLESLKDTSVFLSYDETVLNKITNAPTVQREPDATTSPDRNILEQLLYAVESKFPNETRFETALRYIKQAENKPCNPASAALKE